MHLLFKICIFGFDGEILNSIKDKIRGWYQKKNHHKQTLVHSPYTYVSAQEMWGRIDTCTHIYSEYTFVMFRVSQTIQKGIYDHLTRKIILDSESLQNYRRVSNLPRLSQLIERKLCSISQPSGYEWSMWSFPSSLQAVTQYGSSITSCTNDIFQAIDSCGGAILVIHDLSAAFDMIAQEKPMLTLN